MSACRITRRSPAATPRFTTTSRSAGTRRRCALTSRNYCRTCSKADSTGRVFDRAIGLDEVPDGYRAMDERESIKVMVKP